MHPFIKTFFVCPNKQASKEKTKIIYLEHKGLRKLHTKARRNVEQHLLKQKTEANHTLRRRI